MRHFYILFGSFLYIFNFSEAQHPEIDLSCHPGYFQNKKAEKHVANFIKECDYQKSDPDQCYMNCVMQTAVLSDHTEPNFHTLVDQQHMQFLRQFFSGADAKTLTGKLKENCAAAYTKAIEKEPSSDEDAQHSPICRRNDDVKWHAFYDCVKNVWACKA